MENTERLQKYEFDDYTVVTNFENFEDAEQYAAEKNGELLEVGFTDGADNPVPDDRGQLMTQRKPFRVQLDPDYTVLYSDDPRFDEMAEQIQTDMKLKEGEVTPEDWISDQNLAPGDHIIVIKDGEVNTVTTRERIKFLMRGNVYEIAVKVPNHNH